MSAEHCELLSSLSSNVEYHLVIVVKCIICMLGAFGICYQWSKQGVRFLVHNNTKTVFKFYYALNLFIASVYVMSYVFELVRLRFECAVVNFRTVLLFRGMGLCAMISAHYVLMIISIERVYSSFYPAHFETNSSKRLAVFLSLPAIIISSFCTMFLLSNGFSLLGDHPVAIMHERIAENTSNYNVLVLLGVMFNLLSLVIASLDIYLNIVRKPTDVNPSLSVSYQRAENRKVVLIIVPIELIDSLIGFFTTTALMLQDNIIDASNPTARVIYAETVMVPMLIPLIITIIIELRVARRVRASVTTADTDVNYFENLRRAWDV